MVSLGRLAEAKKKVLGHDTLFHLYSVLTLDNGEEWYVEKNQVIKVAKYHHRPNAERTMDYLVSTTPNLLFANMLHVMGPTQLYVYHPVTANCQNFTINLFQAAGITDPRAGEFILQPTIELFKQLPSWTESIAKGVTDLAGRFDVLLWGKGV